MILQAIANCTAVHAKVSPRYIQTAVLCFSSDNMQIVCMLVRRSVLGIDHYKRRGILENCLPGPAQTSACWSVRGVLFTWMIVLQTMGVLLYSDACLQCVSKCFIFATSLVVVMVAKGVLHGSLSATDTSIMDFSSSVGRVMAKCNS